MADYPDPLELRRRAEMRLRALEPAMDALRSPLEVERLLHELQVHQIELEMQNDELRYVRDQVETLLTRYTDLYEFAPTGYLSVDADGLIVSVNLTASRLLQVERSMLQRRRLSHFLKAEHRRELADFVARVLGGDERATCEVSPLQHSTGTMILRVEGARSLDGAECRIVLLDVTAARNATEALRLHSAALEAAASAIMITDVAGTVEWVNQGFAVLTGYALDDAVGRKVSTLLNAQVHDRATFTDLWETILAGRVWRGELTNRRKDGSHYLEERTITPFVNAHGTPVHFISMGRDLTEQRQMEAQLLQSHKMETVGRLAGGIAHDFNNLLTVINGTVEFAMMGMLPDLPLRRDLEEVKAAGQRAAMLTGQLLAFSRKQIMRYDALNLSTLVVGLQDMLHRLLGKRITLKVVPGDDLGLVRADPIHIEQVILNLAVNARDAMPLGGTLTVSIENYTVTADGGEAHSSVPPGAYVRLVVTDTGDGMTDSVRERAFEPFYTTKGLGEGTGLGLSMVYGIITQSGGSILVQSDVGVGTVFSIYLPRVASGSVTPAVVSTVPHDRGSETVLVVEDDDAVRRVAERVLRHVGYTVISASNGREAIQRLSEQRDTVDLVVTDVVMPEMGGLELAAALHELHPRTKVIFLSGYTDEAKLHDQVRDRTTPFIGKPYTAKELTSRVREVLDA